MAGTDEEDGYSDDDLDALLSYDFLELQQHAIQSTQKHQGQQAVGKFQLPQSHALPVHAAKSARRSATPQNHNFPQEQSSDYGDIDDEILDGEILDVNSRKRRQSLGGEVIPRVGGESTQREAWRQQRYGVPQQLQRSYQPSNGLHKQSITTFPRLPALADSGYAGIDNDEMMLDAPNTAEEDPLQMTSHVDDVDVLQVKVAELLREREKLEQAVKAANDLTFAKSGEISIIRANQTKTAKDYERQLASLQKQHADSAARQKIEFDIARAEREKIVTNNEFLKRDLKEESEKVKQLQRLTKVAGERSTNSMVTTPRKTTTTALPYRDGFDDDDSVAVSQPNAVGRSKAVTPKAGGKRKRKAVEDSPGQPLQLTHPKGNLLSVAAPSQPSRQDDSATKLQALTKEDHRFKITQTVLDHRIRYNEKRSFEALADFAYPSDANTALSSLFLDKLAKLRFRDDTADFPAALGLIVTSLWSKCIEEKYYKPLYLLLDLIKFILLTSPLTTAPCLVDDLVLLTQLTADINVIPRFRHRASVELHLEEDIDTNECLQILHLTASGCARRQEDIERFWRLMRFDFILMMLRNVQPVEDIELMLSLLKTSCLEDSFAMRVDPKEGDQSASEVHVIDRVSAMLIDIPKVAQDERPYDTLEVAQIRFEAIGLIEKICDNRYGGEALARNPYAIGRIVRVMNDELNALYNHKIGHENRAELVNHATRLLYHVTSAYPELINMQEKLRVHPGGANKYLIALTRLAFSEGIFYERGIEDDVVDCAHQMLEDSITPEEGEALLEAFSSARK